MSNLILRITFLEEKFPGCSNNEESCENIAIQLLVFLTIEDVSLQYFVFYAFHRHLRYVLIAF